MTSLHISSKTPSTATTTVHVRSKYEGTDGFSEEITRKSAITATKANNELLGIDPQRNKRSYGANTGGSATEQHCIDQPLPKFKVSNSDVKPICSSQNPATSIEHLLVLLTKQIDTCDAIWGVSLNRKKVK